MPTDWLYPARTAKRTLGSFLPERTKRAAALGYGAWADLRTRSALRKLAKGQGPVFVGPWLSEVGFELLYWMEYF